MKKHIHFYFLNIGHFLDHYFMLIFATAAALRLSSEWGMSYAQLIPYATPGFIAFGVCALPAGWLADKWSRQGMMSVFFLGIGASAILCGLARTPVELAAGLLLVGVFAAIYHPVGLAMVVHNRQKTGMALAINGVYGNLGVACAPLVTALLLQNNGWRSSFLYSGFIALAIGLLYWLYVRSSWYNTENKKAEKPNQSASAGFSNHPQLVIIFCIILFTTALGGLIFQSTTFALPKVLDERLSDLTESVTHIGRYAFFVFSAAAVAQLVVGYLVDRHSIKIIFACVATLQFLLFALMISATGVMSLIIALCFMLAVFGQIPINDVLLGRITRSEWRSRAFALRYLVTFSVMASAVPLIAWIHANWGFHRLFLVLSIAAFFILIAVLLLPRENQPAEATV